MMILIYSAFMVTLTMTMTTHPITMVALIIIQTLIICLLLWSMMATSWFAFILFLIFVGGLMVLFIYTVSLAANEKFEPSLDQMAFNSPNLILYLMLSMIFFSVYLKNSPVTLPMANQVNMMFSQEMIFLTTMIMAYLLVTLIIVVKISNKMEGPLRNLVKK